MREIESATLERLLVPLTTSGDPTGDLPTFGLTQGERLDPGAMVAGSWDGAWIAANGRIDALTPLIGDAGDLVIVQGETYDLWVQWTVGAEVPTRRVMMFRAV